MKKFEIAVEKVTGFCSCGYKPGDTFRADDLNTPDAPMCGGAYTILFPMQTALHSGARFNFEENPQSKTGLACPDNGYVTFRITLME
ncbi:MAG: TIGR04076 family protein [Spirochaetaceae bacterium]|nr:TIGR04076 family protein [Spirochaetaceae bacterium]